MGKCLYHQLWPQEYLYLLYLYLHQLTKLVIENEV